eukprot:Blabericola_migrator_1__5326@NODE_2730_length_2416_cov_75_747126_g1678_i1_p1_GENE_NODE_2730_length_2416_cov_75_747126_g1678_i1NODE_2730_length_2416_cov_75_747126_g1678_i1_p1_ORF_typecomplete_len471_score82_96Lipoprotein_16/PF03923_13/0_22Lipoprotein_10/PF03202_13/0_35_NODE_2730_length_2416_cov_75_747126_g1678_i16512063
MPIPRSVYCQRVPEWKATGLGALSVLTAVSPFDGQTPDHETFKHSPSSPEEVEKFVNTLNPNTRAVFGRIGHTVMEYLRAGTQYVKPSTQTLKALVAYACAQLVSQVRSDDAVFSGMNDTFTDAMNDTFTDTMNDTFTDTMNDTFTHAMNDTEAMDLWRWLGDEWVWGPAGAAGLGFMTCLGVSYCWCRNRGSKKSYTKMDDVENLHAAVAGSSLDKESKDGDGSHCAVTYLNDFAACRPNGKSPKVKDEYNDSMELLKSDAEVEAVKSTDNAAFLTAVPEKPLKGGTPIGAKPSTSLPPKGTKPFTTNGTRPLTEVTTTEPSTDVTTTDSDYPTEYSEFVDPPKSKLTAAVGTLDLPKKVPDVRMRPRRVSFNHQRIIRVYRNSEIIESRDIVEYVEDVSETQQDPPTPDVEDVSEAEEGDSPDEFDSFISDEPHYATPTSRPIRDDVCTLDALLSEMSEYYEKNHTGV